VRHAGGGGPRPLPCAVRRAEKITRVRLDTSEGPARSGAARGSARALGRLGFRRRRSYVRPESKTPRAPMPRQRLGSARHAARVGECWRAAGRNQESSAQSSWMGRARQGLDGARPCYQDNPGPVGCRHSPRRSSARRGFPLGVPLAPSLGVVSGRESRGKPVDGGDGDCAGLPRWCHLGRLGPLGRAGRIFRAARDPRTRMISMTRPAGPARPSKP
jgi:hypothetical protein